jgi:hypothetical protein
MNQCASQAMLQYHAKKKSSRWAIPRNYIPERFLMKCELPNRLQDKTALMPEYSYGVTKIRVTLDDGSRLYDMFIAWGNEIAKVGTGEVIPFDSSRIVAIDP